MTARTPALSPPPLSPPGNELAAGSTAGAADTPGVDGRAGAAGTAGTTGADGTASAAGTTRADGTAGAAGMLISALAIPGRPEHVRAARAFVSLVLGVHRRHDEGIASLLVSELVTNSLLHGDSRAACGTITVTVAVAPGEVLVEVTDNGGGGEPVPRDAGDDAENGRGLHLVAQLSDAWGYAAANGRLTTWFELKAKEGTLGE